MAEKVVANEKENILYVAKFVTVVSNPRHYTIVKLSQEEMGSLDGDQD